MKPAKTRPEETFLDEIVETLKLVPRGRLRIVRDIVGALAEVTAPGKDGVKLKRLARKSLLKTAFCGMWQGRADIDNGGSYARSLRQRLESRGDRT
jgi:hypothetical protein